MQQREPEKFPGTATVRLFVKLPRQISKVSIQGERLEGEIYIGDVKVGSTKR